MRIAFRRWCLGFAMLALLSILGVVDEVEAPDAIGFAYVGSKELSDLV